MLIFNKYGLRVFFMPLPEATRRGEARAVALMLREAFPSEGYELSHEPSGRPFIRALPQVGVSISHCRHGALLAIAEGLAVGVDIESTSRTSQLRRVARRYIADRHIGYWSLSDLNLLLAWIIKEAVFKACYPQFAVVSQVPLPMSTVDTDVTLPDSSHCLLVHLQLDPTLPARAVAAIKLP